jgi:hypothetical protein
MKTKKGRADHWMQAVRAANEYNRARLEGASHKRLHNLQRRIKYNLKKMMR